MRPKAHSICQDYYNIVIQELLASLRELKQGMNVWLLLLSQLVAVAVAAEQLQFAEEWMLWKTQHQRSYSRGQEEVERHSVWLANREFVLTHNANWQEHGYTLALNQFADLVGHRVGNN